MEYSFSFKEVLDALRPCYQSIDLRAVLVALGDGQGWRSVLAIVRFSCKSPEEVSKKHEALRQSHGLPAEFLNRSLSPELSLEPFKGMNVELFAYPIEAFSHVVGNLSAGMIRCKQRSFRVWEEAAGHDLLNERVSWRNDPYATDNGEWPVYYYGTGQKTTQVLGSPDAGGIYPSIGEHDLTRWARGVGFSNFRAMADYLLGSSFGQGGERFEIRVPIYARIDDVVPSEKSVLVRGQFHRQLGALGLECCLVRRGNHPYSISRPELLGRTLLIPETDEDAISFSKEFVMEPPPEAGRVSAVLFEPKPSRLDLGEQSANVRRRIPVFKVFSSFVPEEHISEYLSCLTSGSGVTVCQLYTKFKPQNSSKKIDELLEYVTNYFLGLCQLSPILLSNPKYDELAGGMSAGSADILAITPEKDPILVSCTMAMPDDKKVNMAMSARTAICQRFGWVEDDIKVLLVTGKPSVSQQGAQVCTLGAQDLQQLWTLIQQGDVSQAQSLLRVSHE